MSPVLDEDNSSETGFFWFSVYEYTQRGRNWDRDQRSDQATDRPTRE
jgi:hypothetical protein